MQYFLIQILISRTSYKSCPSLFRIKLNRFYLIALFLGLTLRASAEIKIIFRYDDYLLVKDPFNDSLIDLFSKKDIPVCLGVIPFDNQGNSICSLNNNEISKFKALIYSGKIDIALHGFSHSQNRYNTGEFPGLTYSVQLDMIKKASHWLDSILQIRIVNFIPPWNAYDQNTLKALEASGIKTISSGFYGNQSGSSKVLKFIPYTMDDFSCLKSLVEHHGGENLTIVVMLHQYNFIQSEIVQSVSEKYDANMNKIKQIKLSELDQILEYLKFNKEIHFTTFTDELNSDQEYSLMRLTLNQKSFLVKKIFGYSEKTYLPSQRINNLLWLNRIINALVALLSFIVISPVLKYLKNPIIKKTIILLIITSLIILVISGQYTPLRLLLIVCLSGLLAGFIMKSIIVQRLLEQ